MTKQNTDFHKSPNSVPDKTESNDARSLLETLSGNQMSELANDSVGSHRNRWMPFVIASILSVAWLGVGAYILYATAAFEGSGLAASLSLVSGLMSPLAVIWIMALVFQRTDPMLERRVAVAQTLHKAVAPVEHAERRLVDLQAKLIRDLESIDAVAELASDRISNLEDRFQSQISDLFSAAADTEARTTSIRESLSRERSALKDLTDDVVGRFENVETKVQDMTDQIKITSDEAYELAATSLERSTQQALGLKAAGEDLSDRLGQMIKQMEVHVGITQETAEGVQKRLEDVNSRISQSSGVLKTEMETISTHGDNIADILREQASGLSVISKQTADQADRIEESLLRQAQGVEMAAERAGSASTDIASKFEAQAAEMQQTIDASVDGAAARLGEAGSVLEKHARQAEDISENIHARAMDQTREASEAIWKRAAEINDVLQSTMEQAQKNLDIGAGKIETFAIAAEERTGGVAARAIQHLQQLQASVDAQMHLLEDSAARGQEQLTEISAQLEDSAKQLAAQASSAKAELEGTGVAMDDRMIFISQSIQDMRSKIAHLETDLNGQRTALEETSKLATSSVMDASTAFKGEVEAIRDLGSQASQLLHGETETLKQNISDLGRRGESVRASLDKSGTSVRREAEDFQSKVESAAELTRATSADLSKQHDAMLAGTSEVVENLTSASEKIATEVHKLGRTSHQSKITVDGAIEELRSATDKTRGELNSAVTSAGEALSAKLSSLQSDASKQLSGMSGEFGDILDSLLTEYRRASILAGQEGAGLAQRMKAESTELAQQAERFIDQTSEIEKRIASASKDDFAKTSQMLLESLQSMSIDLSKMLDHDLPDSAWTEYLNGDRSFFARRTVRMGNKAARKAIAAKAIDDIEFRENLVRYTRDFESLMERAMLGDRGSALSVTLISSDMGKLYILLAQSMNKLN